MASSLREVTRAAYQAEIQLLEEQQRLQDEADQLEIERRQKQDQLERERRQKQEQLEVERHQ